ncbi:hypothetical protein SAMN05720766_1402 [Fibrobacter sp. UWH9]|uniref:hypothetical protein n=1 Tax=unclassified Fibrobacter TaxID=2634177 RepID=UPI00091F424E|nr:MULTISPECIES: hypothetical protein [Fibrobacter]MCL4103384.1 hypothetical protein [Fibrobacter succinogenes]SHH92216.1 hypothetical protein SAMN05720766_1402 [Fibrobacter sp. UWH9]
MKILIRLMVISVLCILFSSCFREDSKEEYSFKDLLSQDKHDSTEYFELKLSNNISVKKTENFETTTYFFSDSIRKDFMSLMVGFYSETLALFDLKEKILTKSDTFYYVGDKNRGYFVGDSLKKKKAHLYLIVPSFDCNKKIQNCHPWPFVFQYDSSKVDEEQCKKIMSSLKYLKI